MGEIRNSIIKLDENKSPIRREILYNNMIQMVLLQSFEQELPFEYDRKHFIQEKGTSRFLPSFPIAAMAWSEFLRNELFKYIDTLEAEVLAVYLNPDIPNAVKGHLFELLVIYRFQKNGVENFQLQVSTLFTGANGTVSVPSTKFSIENNNLPSLMKDKNTDGFS